MWKPTTPTSTSKFIFYSESCNWIYSKKKKKIRRIITFGMTTRWAGQMCALRWKQKKVYNFYTVCLWIKESENSRLIALTVHVVSEQSETSNFWWLFILFIHLYSKAGRLKDLRISTRMFIHSVTRDAPQWFCVSFFKHFRFRHRTDCVAIYVMFLNRCRQMSHRCHYGWQRCRRWYGFD